MKRHQLGSARVPVSALSLGSWHTWDRATFDEVKTAIKAWLDKPGWTVTGQVDELLARRL